MFGAEKMWRKYYSFEEMAVLSTFVCLLMHKGNGANVNVCQWLSVLFWFATGPSDLLHRNVVIVVLMMDDCSNTLKNCLIFFLLLVIGCSVSLIHIKNCVLPSNKCLRIRPDYSRFKLMREQSWSPVNERSHEDVPKLNHLQPEVVCNLHAMTAVEPARNRKQRCKITTSFMDVRQKS